MVEVICFAAGGIFSLLFAYLGSRMALALTEFKEDTAIRQERKRNPVPDGDPGGYVVKPKTHAWFEEQARNEEVDAFLGAISDE